MHRHHCPGCAGVLANIALSMPVLCWRCHQHCPGLFALIALALLPSSQTSVCPTKTQLLHIRVCGLIVVVIVLARGLIAISGVVPWSLCLRWSSGCSVGVFASVVLGSLAALRRCHHQHCTVVVAGVVPASFPLSHGRFCPCRAGIIALVILALPPALQTGICPGTKQSQHALVSSPALRCCCCQCCAGIIPLVAWALLPLSCWRCCSWHTRIAASITNWHLPSHDAVVTRCW